LFCQVKRLFSKQESIKLPPKILATKQKTTGEKREVQTVRATYNSKVQIDINTYLQAQFGILMNEKDRAQGGHLST
jgi:hypothetical protein